MGDCRDCKWDDTANTCKQGHFRAWGYVDGIKAAISDCHAWRKKEKKESCSCWVMMWGMLANSFDITCKKCGRKIL